MNLEHLTQLHSKQVAFANDLAVQLQRINALRQQALQLADEYGQMINEVIDSTVTEAEAPKPEVKKPEVKKPEVKKPEVKKPEAPKAVLMEAEAPKAEVKKAEAPKPVKKAKEDAFVVPPGAKPTLKQALLVVMGDKAMGVDEALDALKKRGWAPTAADPRGYLAHRMSQTKELFERVGKRGKKPIYRVRADAEAPAIKTRKTRAKKMAPKAKAAKKTAPKPKAAKPEAPKKGNSKSDTEILNEFGISDDSFTS